LFAAYSPPLSLSPRHYAISPADFPFAATMPLPLFRC
jgi:hypothetical protein